MNTAVIFDMDGVIIDTEPLYTRAEIKLFREYGIEIPKEDWSLFRGCSEEDLLDAIEYILYLNSLTIRNQKLNTNK